MVEIILSPSKIFAFETCPRQFYLRYFKKAITPKKLEKHMHLGSLIHKALEYLAEYPIYENIDECITKSIKELDVVVTPDMVQDAKSQIINWFDDSKFKNECLASEFEFYNDLGNGITVRGIIDRVERISPTTIKVIDYKTGGRIYTDDDLNDSNQLLIYAIVAQQEWDAENVVICYDMITHNRRTEVLVRPSEFKNKLEYIKETHNRMKSGENEPILSGNCSYCPYKHSCNEYIGYLKENLKIDKIQDILEADFEDAITYIKELDDKKKVIETHITEAKRLIVNEILSAGERKLTLGKYNLQVVAPKRREYDTNIVAEIFKDNLSAVLKPNKKQVDLLMQKKSVEDKAMIISTAIEKEGNPYLKITEAKKSK